MGGRNPIYRHLPGTEADESPSFVKKKLGTPTWLRNETFHHVRYFILTRLGANSYIGPPTTFRVKDFSFEQKLLLARYIGERPDEKI